MNLGSKIGIVLACVGVCITATFIHEGFELRPEPTRPGALYDVVLKQISAVRTADFSSAYQQVSSTFQERYDIDAFSDHLRTDYPELSRTARIEFGPVEISGRRAVVEVYFVLKDGDVVPAIYNLISEGRQWKIDGARVQKRWPPSRHLGGMRS